MTAPARSGRMFLRFVLLLVPLQVAIAAGLGVYAHDVQERNLAANLELQVEQTARYVSAALHTKIIEGDLEGAERLVGNLADENVLRCAMFGPKGEPAFDSAGTGSEDDPAAALIAEARTTSAVVQRRIANTSRVAVAVPVPVATSSASRADVTGGAGRASAAPRAYAYAELSTERHDRLIRDFRLQIIAAAAAFVLVTTAGSMVLARHVTRPVAELARAADRISKGDFDVTCRMDRRDEIGALADAFDQMVGNVRDAHGELRRAGSFLEGVIESMPDAVLLVERPTGGAGEWTIVRANLTAGRVLAAAQGTLSGRAVVSIFPDAQAGRAFVERLAEDGAVEAFEALWVPQSGPRREVVLSASGVRTAESAPGSPPDTFVVVARDVTVIRRAERRRAASFLLSGTVHATHDTTELLERVEGVLRDVLPVSAFHVALCDERTGAPRIARWSNAHAADPAANECVSGLTSHALRATTPVVLTAAQIEAMVRRGDVEVPAPVPAWWVGTPIRLEGRTLGALVVQNDDPAAILASSELEVVNFAAEQVAVALRRLRTESERARLSTAVAAAADAILITGPDGRVVYANSAHARQSGWADAEAAQLTLDRLWDAEGDAGTRAAIASADAGVPWTGRIECRRADHSTYPADCALSRVADAAGGTLHYVVVLHDVTHEVRLAEQLHHAQKMEALGILAGGVAHDFNNLLSVIIGYADLLGNVVTDARQRGFIDQVRHAGDRAAALVQQLLASSRRQVRKPRLIDLGAVIREMEPMLRRLVGEDVELRASVAAHLPRVEADASQVESVIMNLVVNARDAMPQGGDMHVAVGTESVEAGSALAHDGLTPGPHVVLSVTDTGQGIPPETLQHVFEPFFTTKPKGRGTGLGLSTVYGIARQSGGCVTVRSVVGQGSTFSVHLPCAAASALADSTEAASTVAPGGRESILLAEDEEGVRSFLTLVLGDAGYEVHAASNGPDAIRVARAHGRTFDLLLTDVVMPKMSGRVLADTLLAEGLAARALFMSGYPDRAIASHGVVDQGTDLIGKPFSRTQILARIRAALDRAPAPSSTAISPSS